MPLTPCQLQRTLARVLPRGQLVDQDAEDGRRTPLRIVDQFEPCRAILPHSALALTVWLPARRPEAAGVIGYHGFEIRTRCVVEPYRSNDAGRRDVNSNGLSASELVSGERHHRVIRRTPLDARREQFTKIDPGSVALDVPEDRAGAIERSVRIRSRLAAATDVRPPCAHELEAPPCPRRRFDWYREWVYYERFLPRSRWESALPAADFELVFVRPSRSVSDALDAASDEVSFPGARRCDNALPAPLFESSPVAGSRSVFDAFDAAFDPVCLPFGMVASVVG